MADIVMDTQFLSTIKKDEVLKELEAPSEEKQQIMELAQKNVENMLSINVEDMKERKSITDMIDTFGDKAASKAAKKNQLVSVSLGQLSERGGESGEIAKQLDELNTQLKVLDPSKVDFTEKGLFGAVAKPIKRYFKKYKSAGAEIDQIINNLSDGKKTLQDDNTTLMIEQGEMRENTKELERQFELGTQMDACLEQAIAKAKAEGADEYKIKFMENDVLFPLRQKLTDIAQMLAVNQQGYFSTDIVIKNNKELIRTVTRVQNVAATALRTGVMVASALYNQRIVIESVNNTNALMNNLIENTSNMIKSQGTEIHRQAVESSLDIEKLKQAYITAYEAMDEIETFKQDALPILKTNIEQFKQLTVEGEKRIQRMEHGYTA